MVIQVNQELCAGCGVCVDACSVGAIQLVDQRTVIDEALCTQCAACVDACPNEAITESTAPFRSDPVVSLPAVEYHMVPAPTQTLLPVRAAPNHGLAPLAGAALAFLGKEVAPRLFDVLAAALERRLEQPKSTAGTPISTLSGVLTAQYSEKQRQNRYRGGRTGTRNHKGRR